MTTLTTNFPGLVISDANEDNLRSSIGEQSALLTSEDETSDLAAICIEHLRISHSLMYVLNKRGVNIYDVYQMAFTPREETH